MSKKRGIKEVDASISKEDHLPINDALDIQKTKKQRLENVEASSSAIGAMSWNLSSGKTPRRLEISEFKNTKLVNIREFYEKDGNWLPGKKGISLTMDQYKALLVAIPKVNESLRSLGVSLADDNPENSDLDIKPQKKPQLGKATKSNIDTTSDEDDG